MNNKKIVKLTESDLHKIVKESVKRVLKEDISDDGEWKYQGSKVDKYMWALKKDAMKRGETREDGWPSENYIYRWFEYAENVTDGGMSASFSNVYGYDYSISELWEMVDHFLYHCKLRFGNDVLGRRSQNTFHSWFR